MNRIPDYHKFQPLWTKLIERALKEDAWHWDWTSAGLFENIQGPQKSRASLWSKAAGVFCGKGILEAANLFSIQNQFQFKVDGLTVDGQRVRAGHELARFEGSASMILGMERVLLNLIGYSSGIATRTAQLVDGVANISREKNIKAPRVSTTRKILPFYRDLAIYSVICGGGYSHRLNLGSGILIKENHIQLYGGLLEAVRQVRDQAPHGMKIETEVRSTKELEIAIQAQVDAVLLDNFSQDELMLALQMKSKHPQLFFEVSGGIHEGNLERYVYEGIDLLSSGSITHSVESLDISLLMEGIHT